MCMRAPPILCETRMANPGGLETLRKAKQSARCHGCCCWLLAVAVSSCLPRRRYLARDVRGYAILVFSIRVCCCLVNLSVACAISRRGLSPKRDNSLAGGWGRSALMLAHAWRMPVCSCQGSAPRGGRSLHSIVVSGRSERTGVLSALWSFILC